MMYRHCIGLSALLVVLAAGCASSPRKVTAPSMDGLVADAEAFLRRGQPMRAASLLEQVNARSGTPALRRQEAAAWLAAGQQRRAESVLEEDGPDGPPEWHLLMAVVRLDRDDLAAANGHVARYLGAFPLDPGALALHSEISFRLSDTRRAIESLQSADGLLGDGDPLKTRVLHNLAVLQLMEGEFAAADLTFSRYLVLDGGFDDHALAGAVAYAVSDHERASRHWQMVPAEMRVTVMSVVGDESDYYERLVN